MGRAPCCDKASVKKGPWSPEEDAKLKDFIHKHGTGGNWIALPHKAGLKRCGKSCRLRWLNYLRPNIKHGEFSEDEDRIICSLYASIGSRWSIIAGQLPGRTDNDIKNYWNTKLRKKILAMLPSFQKKPSFFPSMPLQSPTLSGDHKLDSFLNASSSFYNYNPNFMNVNSHLTTTTYSLVPNNINVTNLFSPPSSNPLIGMISNNNHYVGFQSQNTNEEYYYPEVKERMLMFGSGVGVESSTTCSPSERGGSCINNGNKDLHQIKQEDQFALEGFGQRNHVFMTDDHSYVDQKSTGHFKNLEEVKQLAEVDSRRSSTNVDINSYLMNDDENKTTHIVTDGCTLYDMMIDGGN